MKAQPWPRFSATWKVDRDSAEKVLRAQSLINHRRQLPELSDDELTELVKLNGRQLNANTDAFVRRVEETLTPDVRETIAKLDPNTHIRVIAVNSPRNIVGEEVEIYRHGQHEQTIEHHVPEPFPAFWDFVIRRIINPNEPDTR